MFRFALAVVAVRASVLPGEEWRDDGLSLLQMKKTTVVAAEGDPPMTSAVGDHSDMCCEGEGKNRVCKPCGEVSLLRSTDRSGEEKGHEVKQRALTDETIDAASGYAVVDFDAGPFTTYGVITGARIFVSSPGNKKLQFRTYRPFLNGVKSIGFTAPIDTSQPGVQEVTFSPMQGGPPDGVAFIPGDFIGWSTTGSGVFPYDITGEAVQDLNPGGNPNVGVRFEASVALWQLCTLKGMKRGYEKRTYSYTVFTRPAVESDYQPHNLCNFGPGFEEQMDKMRSEGAFDPPEDDEGAAVGDPHLTHSGKSFDMDESMVHH